MLVAHAQPCARLVHVVTTCALRRCRLMRVDVELSSRGQDGDRALSIGPWSAAPRVVVATLETRVLGDFGTTVIQIRLSRKPKIKPNTELREHKNQNQTEESNKLTFWFSLVCGFQQKSAQPQNKETREPLPHSLLPWPIGTVVHHTNLIPPWLRVHELM